MYLSKIYSYSLQSVEIELVCGVARTSILNTSETSSIIESLSEHSELTGEHLENSGEREKSDAFALSNAELNVCVCRMTNVIRFISLFLDD